MRAYLDTSAFTMAASRPRTAPLSTIRAALTAWRHRHTLAGLEDHMLADIGLTRAEAEAEARRPIWDIPAGLPR